jgi:hypothetical protein
MSGQQMTQIKNNIKNATIEILKIAIGLPLMAAGFLLLALGSMAVLFGIPFLLMSSGNTLIHTVGIVWAFLSVFGFFGYLLVMMES